MTHRLLLGALCLALPHAIQPARAQTAPAAGIEAPAGSTGAGGLAIDTPWLRATPNGAKVAGGYVGIANAGPEADRLVGAAIPQAGRGEVHSMSMEGGVMRMAPVAGGLAIEPGGRVALKPGGYHLMFLDLTSPLQAGSTVRGSLTFARAGTVPVTFMVAPIGAQGPAGASGGGHGHGH